MAQSEESLHTTRRRVWRFVFGCLGVVLVAALWPLRGHEIDENLFLSGLAPTYFKPSTDTGHAADSGNHVCDLQISAAPTTRKCLRFFNIQVDAEHEFALEYLSFHNEGVIWAILPEVEASAFVWRHYVPMNQDVIGFHWHHRNVFVGGEIDYGLLSGEKTREQVAGEVIESIRDGLDREIPGVTTFYNPPARQLYYDRVRPFLAKHFPKAFAP